MGKISCKKCGVQDIKTSENEIGDYLIDAYLGKVATGKLFRVRGKLTNVIK